MHTDIDMLMLNVYSPIIIPAHILASTNIYTLKHIHRTLKHTNTHTGAGTWTYTVQYLPMSQASDSGLFCEHKHHSK